MASFAPTAKPPWSTVIWVDDENIYVEYPTVGSIPFIATFTKTSGGLAKAISIMEDCHKAARGPRTYTPPKPHVSTKLVNSTPLQREQARAILKRLKIIP